MRKKDPVFRTMGPQTEADFNWLKQTYADAYTAAEGRKKERKKMLDDLIGMFDTNYNEERKHRRALEEKQIEKQNTYGEKMETREYQENRDEYKWQRQKEWDLEKEGRLAKQKQTKAPTEKRVAYRDTAPAAKGSVNWYNINDPRDRETLQNYGSQLKREGQKDLEDMEERENATENQEKTKEVSRAKESPPAKVVASLKEDRLTTFRNGQVWTLQNGKPVRIR
jgi:hypothetical protein